MLLRRFKLINIIGQPAFSTLKMDTQKIVLDPFSFKAFEAKEDGTPASINFDKDEFTKRVNEFYIQNKATELKDGYAPFWKHLFIENFTNATSGTVEITEENKKLIESGYDARRDNEIPVLCRWFPKESVDAKKAKYLDIILYSHDQVIEEHKAMSKDDEPAPNSEIDFDYAIISIKTQDVNYELPMQPITIMRNCLGKEHGGSGIPIDEEKYRESVEYWQKNVLIK